MGALLIVSTSGKITITGYLGSVVFRKKLSTSSISTPRFVGTCSHVLTQIPAHVCVLNLLHIAKREGCRWILKFDASAVFEKL